MDVFDRAKQLGIQTEFVDGQGHRHVTDATALKIILDALPERIPTRLVDGPVVIRTGETSRTEFSPAAVLPVTWKIIAGQKIIAQGETSQRTIVWPADWEEGIYRLQLRDATSFSEEVPLIVSPPRAYAGDFDRGWLLAIQLYGIRSARNWGIGDFTDLAARCTRCSTTSRPIAALIRPTAGCFSTRSISTSNKSPNLKQALKPAKPPRGCVKAISSTTKTSLS